ncbi:MAG TPA: peptidylprolyl isomerase [Thermoanaerobaculia bacterium]|nr:peptidylprolyl isomerase [Thermoanaerobaculia bacterium]
MKAFLAALLLALPLAAAAQPPAPEAKPAPAPAPAPSPAEEEVGVLETTLGTMVIRFHEQDAPQTVANFKKLVRDGFYDGRNFYRIVKGHVIQAGDGGENDKPKIKGEFNSRPFVPGAVGLARGGDPDSGSTEFFICHVARPHLDGKYANFGQLVEGMDVMEKIASVEVEEQWIGDEEPKVAFHGPKTPVVISKARIEKRALPPAAPAAEPAPAPAPVPPPAR